MGNGINEKMLYLCLLRLPSKESSNILINVSSTTCFSLVSFANNSRLRGLNVEEVGGRRESQGPTSIYLLGVALTALL